MYSCELNPFFSVIGILLDHHDIAQNLQQNKNLLAKQNSHRDQLPPNKVQKKHGMEISIKELFEFF